MGFEPNYQPVMYLIIQWATKKMKMAE